jgi:hypothetical protein
MADSAFCIEVQAAAVPPLVSLKEKVVASYSKVCCTWFHLLAVKSGVVARVIFWVSDAKPRVS